MGSINLSFSPSGKTGINFSLPSLFTFLSLLLEMVTIYLIKERRYREREKGLKYSIIIMDKI